MTDDASNAGSYNLSDMAGSSGGQEADVNTNTDANTDVNTENASGNQENIEWYLDFELKGDGEKPEWFNNKQYKTVFEQAKSATEMRKKLGAFSGSPDEYKVELSDELKDIHIDLENPLIKDVTAFAKENKMNQEGYNKLINSLANYSKLQNTKANEEATNFQKKEIDALGGVEEAKQKLDEMGQWFSQNFPGYKGEDFKDMLYFADGFNIMKAIREKVGFSKIPNGNESFDSTTSHELQSLINDPKYLSDLGFQKMVDQKYNNFYGNK